ncbi:chitin binding peritrophin-A domain-containing protein [Zooshikella sp. RANM57]|uniref:chitin binding peritrophin-A domain-containing protein n=1 Tax=Zooshikella sp. RANM57 TaxID=3425863 RepID=UPI003D6E8F11
MKILSTWNIRLIPYLFLLLLTINEKISANEFNCSGLPDGSYSACPCCQNFYYCAGGVSFSLQCPGNTYYNPVTNRCDSWSNIPSCGGQNTTSGCLNTCAEQQDGIYQYCENCNQAVVCIQQMKFMFTCNQPGLNEYDSDLGRCVEKSHTCP